MYKFKAQIEIIGVNPYVLLPGDILESIFNQAGKSKGYIPVRGTINAQPYAQTLVKFSGLWRLYINTTMLKNSPLHVGETIELTIELDPSDRSIRPHPKLLLALAENPEAQNIFEKLPASRRHEIVRYIASLKTDESIERNIIRAIDFLLGRTRFVGRDKP